MDICESVLQTMTNHIHIYSELSLEGIAAW